MDRGLCGGREGVIIFASSQKEDETDSLIDKEGKNRYGVTRSFFLAIFFFGNLFLAIQYHKTVPIVSS